MRYSTVAAAAALTLLTVSASLHGQNADVLLVLAEAADGLAVFEVDPKAAGVAVAALPTFDHTLRLARIAFKGAAGRRLLATRREAIRTGSDVRRAHRGADTARGGPRYLRP